MFVVTPPITTPFEVVERTSEGCLTNKSGYSALSLGCFSQIIVHFIGLAFQFLGLVTLVFLLWGAIKFVISSGDPKAIQSAKNTMTYAIIGAIIVLGSFILISVITTALNIPNPALDFSIYIH